MSDNLTEEFNKEVVDWGEYTSRLLKSSIAALGMKGKGDLMRQLRMKTKKDFGEIDRVWFSFPRHGVFVQKGVGRGYLLVGGKVIRDQRTKLPDKKDTNLSKKRASAFQKGGSWYGAINPKQISKIYPPRVPKDWVNPVLDQRVPKLVELITNIRADTIFDSTHFKIRT